MNVSFVGIVFNGSPFLEACIEAVKPFGPVYFVEGPVSHYGKLGFTTSTDDTNQVLADLIGEAHVYHGQFEEKDEMMWASERLIPQDSTFVFMVDSDEVWRRQDLEKIFALLETNKYDSMAFTADSFWCGYDHIVTGWERDFQVHRVKRWKENPHWVTHRPPTVNAPDGSPWREHRHLSHLATLAMGLSMPHYSYVNPLQVRMKDAYYNTYDPTMCIPGYFREVFIAWARGNEEARREIEKKYQGVHNFRANRRGPCFTQKFTGQHPESIQKRLPQLQARFDQELSEVIAEMRCG